MHEYINPFAEPFSGFFEPRKAFREKTPRGYRKGTDSPLARKILHGKRKPKQDVHSGYAEGISLSRELGAIA